MCRSCRARKMLSNAYVLAKFRFDTAENEPAKNLQNFKFCKTKLIILHLSSPPRIHTSGFAYCRPPFPRGCERSPGGGNHFYVNAIHAFTKELFQNQQDDEILSSSCQITKNQKQNVDRLCRDYQLFSILRRMFWSVVCILFSRARSYYSARCIVFRPILET